MMRLLFLASGGKSWIGGLYYIKNMLYGLVSARDDSESLECHVLVTPENLELFEPFRKFENIVIKVVKHSDVKESNKLVQLFLNKNYCEYIEDYVRENEIDWVFPVTGRAYSKIEKKCIFWIPDFQFMIYPKNFSRLALAWKRSLAQYIARHDYPIVLSSKSAKSDYVNHFRPNEVSKICVVPFVSWLPGYVKDKAKAQRTMDNFGVTQPYILCSNQFWRHKNHEVVVDALQTVLKTDKEIDLVLTGNTDGGDGGKAYESLMNRAMKLGVDTHIKSLGFIDRDSQLDLMSLCKCVVQPSLFEGWGTVFEDAKTLAVPIILSDIPIHKEQAENCSAIFFDPHSADDLAEKIILLLNGCVHYEFEDVQMRAKRYGRMMISFLEGMERNCV